MQWCNMGKHARNRSSLLSIWLWFYFCSYVQKPFAHVSFFCHYFPHHVYLHDSLWGYNPQFKNLGNRRLREPRAHRLAEQCEMVILPKKFYSFNAFSDNMLMLFFSQNKKKILKLILKLERLNIAKAFSSRRSKVEALQYLN